MWLTAALLGALAAAPDLPARSSAQALIDAGRYAEALTTARQTLTETEATEGPDSPAAARALDDLVEARLQAGEGADPDLRAQAERALRLRAAAGTADPERIAALRRLARLVLDSGRRLEALPLFEQAVASLRAEPPSDPAPLADALEDLAAGLLAAERGQDVARTLAELERADELYAVPPVIRARRLDLRARHHARKGQYDALRERADEALRLLQDAAPEHADLARLLHTRADADWFLGRYDDARAGYERALDLARRRLGPRHPFVATCLSDVALSEEENGDVQAALELRRQALAVTLGARGREHPETVDRLHGLGDAHYRLGLYAEARAHYEQALALAVTVLGPDALEGAGLHYNLALVQAHLGEVAESARETQAALDTWTRVLGPGHVHRARALEARGEIFQELGRDDEARPLLEECVALRAAALAPEHPLLLRARSLLAATLDRLGETAAALRQLDLATAPWRSADKPAQIAFADPLERRARVLLAHGRFEEARRDFDGVLGLLVPRLGDDHPAVADARAGLAACALGQGRGGEALALALQADGARRWLVEQTLRHLSEREALTFVAHAFEGRDLALSAITAKTATPTDGTRVFDAVVRGRARVFDETAARARRLRATHAPAEGDLAARWSDVQRRYAQVLMRARGASFDEESVQRLADARQAKERVEREWAAAAGDSADRVAHDKAGAEALSAALPNDAALVAFVRYVRTHTAPSGQPGAEPAYLAFVLRDGARRPTVVPLGDAGSLDDLVRAWRRRAADDVATIAAPSRAVRDYLAAARPLTQRIWSPLLPALRGARTVFLVPDGALHLVSFPTLLSPSGRYLAQEGPRLVMLTAERDLLAPPAEAGTGHGLLALGGADFDARSAPPPDADAGRATSAPPSPSHAAIAAACTPLGPFRPLDFTRLEVDQIARLWRGDPARGPVEQLTGAQAGKAELLRAARGKRILHLATHGFFSSGACHSDADEFHSGFDVDALALSGLALAGANDGDARDDGLLTAEELATWDLSGVELAVLSACETGVGEVRAAEGVLGLQRAFRLAGARSVVMSLWRVPDEASARLMALFYEARLEHGLGAAEALQDARAKLLRERHQAGSSTHPFFWGAFVSTGDWR